MNKKLFILPVLFVLVPTVVFAANFVVQDTYFLKGGESLAGDTYVVSGDTTIIGDMLGDLTVVGGSVLVSGSVEQDLLVVGGSFDLLGPVKDDLRAVGGSLTVSSSVAGDLVAVGGQINILPGSVVGGDVLTASGKLSIEGKVNGSVHSAGQRLYINSEIAGSVFAYSSQIVLGPQASIAGDFTYRSSSVASIDPSAKIAGKTDFRETARYTYDEDLVKKLFVGAFSLVHLIKFFAYLASVLIFVLLLKRLSRDLVHQALDKFKHNLLIGFLVAILMPVAAVLLVLTLVASPIGLLVLLGYTAWLILAWLAGALIAGAWLYKLYVKKPLAELNWKVAVIGVLFLGIVGIVPLVGWLIRCVFVLVALGVFAKTWYRHIWLNR